MKRGMSPGKAKELREIKGVVDKTNLQKIRVEKGLSQNDLAVMSQVPLRTIQCYEQGSIGLGGARLDTLDI